MEQQHMITDHQIEQSISVEIDRRNMARPDCQHTRRSGYREHHRFTFSKAPQSSAQQRHQARLNQLQQVENAILIEIHGHRSLSAKARRKSGQNRRSEDPTIVSE